MFGTILMMALAIAVVALGPAGLPGGGNIPLVALLGLGLIVFGLVIFVSYANLLDGLRQQIDRHLVGRARMRRTAARSRPIGEDALDATSATEATSAIAPMPMSPHASRFAWGETRTIPGA